MIALLLAGLAWGGVAVAPDAEPEAELTPGLSVLAALPPLPDAPVRPPDQEGDCPVMAGAFAGSSRDCHAVSLPPSYLAHLEEIRVYSDQVRMHLVATRAVYASDLRNAEDAIAWRDAEIAYLRKPKPFFQQPAVHVTLGVLGGVGLCVAAGYAMGQLVP